MRKNIAPFFQPAHWWLHIAKESTSLSSIFVFHLIKRTVNHRNSCRFFSFLCLCLCFSNCNFSKLYPTLAKFSLAQSQPDFMYDQRGDEKLKQCCFIPLRSWVWIHMWGFLYGVFCLSLLCTWVFSGYSALMEYSTVFLPLNVCIFG